MDRCIGYDLNGWYDRAARNWLAQPGGDVAEQGLFVLSGGIGGVVVRVEDDGQERFVGGALARMAPQGRGKGWGEVGATERRFAVRALLDRPQQFMPQIASALAALGSRADYAVAAIGDDPGTNDIKQEALLGAMRLAGCRRALHVWRPVLAALWALEQGWLEEADSVAVVSQTAEGLTTQNLTLRRGSVRAPERRRVGQLHTCGFGFQPRLQQSQDVARTLFPSGWQVEVIEDLEMPVRAALGFASIPELCRSWNGSWHCVEAIPPTEVDLNVNQTVLDAVSNSDAILVETVAEGAPRAALLDCFQARFGGRCVGLPCDAVAKGALLAAARLCRGDPVYFDFLPQIATIVQEGKRLRSFNLIPEGTLLPAGKVYRSERPAVLALRAGQDRISIHLSKEMESAPRSAEISLPAKSTSIEEVKVYVEQAPALGRARIFLESSILRTPIGVDWDHAKAHEKDWEALIESLQPTPTIPRRLVLRATADLWRERPGIRGLTALLRTSLASGTPDWEQLADKLSSREAGAYCLTSDGELPTGLGSEEEALLNKVSAKALAHSLARAEGRTAEDDNDALRFLTWLFRRCDQGLAAPMIAALESDIGDHPFHYAAGSYRLIAQGLGRVLREPETIRQVFDHLLTIPRQNWTAMNHVSCAAFLLSRTDEAPLLLDREEVEILADIAIRTLREAIDSVTLRTLHYPPFLLVGLLRWRLRDPWALVAGQDPVADRMVTAVDYAISRLPSLVARRPSLKNLLSAMEEVREELKGSGQNPDILMTFAAMS